MSKRGGGGGGGGRGKVSHKGRRRHFTDAEDIQQDLEKAKREQEWRESKESGSDDNNEEGGGNENNSSDEEEDDKHKPKGVSGLIEIENPNRAPPRMKKTATNVEPSTAASSQPLSRREREELAKQQDRIRHQKLYAEGKSEQAKADLARLAIIRREREEKARKREEEKKAKEEAKGNKK